MKPIHWILILVILIILNIIIFAILYWKSDTNEYTSFEEGLYLSVQIQTTIGYSDFTENRGVRRMVTIQSLIAYLLNIISVIFLGLWVTRLFPKSKFSVESNKVN